MLQFIITATVVLLLSSCSTTNKVGLLGTRSVDLTGSYEKVGPTEGYAETTMLLVFMLDPVANPLDAVDEAMKTSEYAFMTNVEVTQSFLYFVIGLTVEYEVTGTLWKNSDARYGQSQTPKYIIPVDGKYTFVDELPEGFATPRTDYVSK